MATPLVGHLNPEFFQIMDDIKAMTQETLQTRNELTFVVSAPRKCWNGNLFNKFLGTRGSGRDLYPWCFLVPI